jgi:single-strand DNA-binding protein
MNKTFLVGHLTKDPELKYTNDSTAVATFTVAVNRQFSNAQGEKEADYINIVVWRKQAENVKKYCLKGSLVGIDGRIQTRTYKDKDNKTVYVTEVVADNVTFLGAKSQSNGQAVTPNDFSDLSTKTSNAIDDSAFEDFGNTVELTDDDIAF